MKKYKYLIFDADHTLVDFTLDERDALKRIFDENGFAYTEEELIRSSKISLDDWVEMGLTEEADALRARSVKKSPTLLQRRLENEINALYDRLAQALKTENERLRAENERLKAENEQLKA